MDANIQKYIAFVKTVECKSFTKAAEQLSYAQSSVSKMIADLENEWHLSLLERSRNGVKLTSDGLKVLPYVRKIVDDFMQMQDSINEINEIKTGIIRIGTFSSVATHWMPNIIKAFQKDYPNIEYELLTGDYDEIENWLKDGRVDCGFLRLPTQGKFDTISLEDDRFVVVLPKNHPLAQKKLIDPKDLNNQPFMLLEHGGKTEISEFLEEYNLNPKIKFTTWDDYAIMSMAESGQGIAILPRLILKRIPYDIEIRDLSVSAQRKIGLALRSQSSASSAVKRFIDYLKYRNGQNGGNLCGNE